MCKIKAYKDKKQIFSNVVKNLDLLIDEDDIEKKKQQTQSAKINQLLINYI